MKILEQEIGSFDDPIAQELIISGYLLDYGINRWKTGGTAHIMGDPEEGHDMIMDTRPRGSGALGLGFPGGGRRNKKKKKKKKKRKQK